MHTRARGFTLVELLIAAAIIGILARIALPAYHSYIAKAAFSAALTELSAGEPGVDILMRDDPDADAGAVFSASGLPSGTSACSANAATAASAGSLDLTCTIAGGPAGIAGRHVRVSRDVNGGWVCRTDIAPSYTVATGPCRTGQALP
jgi:type IV pilus assembly protein PilA